MEITDRNIRKHAPVSSVVERFKHRAEVIEAAFKQSHDFRILAKDHESCSRALDRWNRAESAIAVQRREEYAVLLAELDHEIQDWLDAFERND